MTGLPEELQERLDLINHKLKYTDQRPMVACIVSLDPLQLATDILAQQIGLAGGIPIAGDADTMLQLNPDVIIFKPDGYNIEQAMAAFDQLFDLPGFDALKAIKNNRFYIVAGDRDFSGDDETFVSGVELLAEIIYPKQFIFGHEGEGWVKFSLS